MPARLEKVLFLVGLTAYTVGQVVINSLRNALHTQSPIDDAHWLLLIGVVLLVPFAVNLRGNILSFLSG
jgi:hypothetical protein